MLLWRSYARQCGVTDWQSGKNSVGRVALAGGPLTLPKPQAPQAPGPDAEQGPKPVGRGARAGTVWSMSAKGHNPQRNTRQGWRNAQSGGAPLSLGVMLIECGPSCEGTDKMLIPGLREWNSPYCRLFITPGCGCKSAGGTYP